MAIDKKYINLFHEVSSRAALAAYFYVGKKDKIAADKAAVDSMRNNLNKIDMCGQIVIGEGELDDAPMLYIGENLGTGKGPNLDIAVDPLEGTNFAANNLPGALSVIAVAEKTNLFNAPETYMDKIAINSHVKGIVDLDFSIKKNIENLSDYLNKSPNEITACLLNRPRHQKKIDELKTLGVKLKLIEDGDVSGALLVSNNKHGVDIFMGIGGGPEGVLAASALDTYECFFQGKFIFENENDKNRAKKMGITDFDKKYELNEIISGDSIFCATGITSGELVSGIKLENNEFISETLITHKSSKLKKILKTKLNIR
jgi:fructose-1,6-bisphosphatase II / sedoheptulose-1,7-bisphosphatase